MITHLLTYVKLSKNKAYAKSYEKEIAFILMNF